MRVLIIKTSSLGDVIHTLPALTDARLHNATIQFDWVVEENFAEIPRWHSAGVRVIPVALRRWRKSILHTIFSGQWKRFKNAINQQEYDIIIDAQGLIKSAFLAYQATGSRHGFDKESSRESLASLTYHETHIIPKNQHAITRIRQLFSSVLNYPLPYFPPDYGIIQSFAEQRSLDNDRPYVIFLHGTTWHTKKWPLEYWQALARHVIQSGYAVYLLWGSLQEHDFAKQLANIDKNIHIIPRSKLWEIGVLMVRSTAIVGVDTGLAHLAAALSVPTITLYGATSPEKTGTYGKNQIHLQSDYACVPCFKKSCHYRNSSIHPVCYTKLSVDTVWANLQTLF
jgi:heptosyltransferase-1